MTDTLSFDPPPDISFHVRLSCGLGPSLNKRLHFMARSRQTKKVRTRTATRAESWMEAHARPRADRHATLLFTVLWPKSQRYFDDDNLLGMLKPVRDGLVDAGVIAGDNPRWLSTWPPRQERHPLITDPTVRVDVTYD